MFHLLLPGIMQGRGYLCQQHLLLAIPVSVFIVLSCTVSCGNAQNPLSDPPLVRTEYDPTRMLPGQTSAVRGRARDPWRSASLSPVAGTVLAVSDPIAKKCPMYWLQNGDHCYKFVRSPKKNRNAAKTQCKVSLRLKCYLLCRSTTFCYDISQNIEVSCPLQSLFLLLFNKLIKILPSY